MAEREREASRDMIGVEEAASADREVRKRETRRARSDRPVFFHRRRSATGTGGRGEGSRGMEMEGARKGQSEDGGSRASMRQGECHCANLPLPPHSGSFECILTHLSMRLTLIMALFCHRCHWPLSPLPHCTAPSAVPYPLPSSTPCSPCMRFHSHCPPPSAALVFDLAHASSCCFFHSLCCSSGYQSMVRWRAS